MADDCLFCKIVRGEIPATVVFRNDRVVAFRDIKPEAPTHILVVPTEHIRSLNEVTGPAVVGELAMAAAQLAKSEGIAESGYRTVINTNRGGGQTVFHLHLHLLGGRSMAWPPG